MEKNIGEKDKLVRLLTGAIFGLTSLAVLTGYIQTAELYSPVLGVISLVLIATAFTEKCGLYQALGIDTCKVR